MYTYRLKIHIPYFVFSPHQSASSL